MQIHRRINGKIISLFTENLNNPLSIILHIDYIKLFCLGSQDDNIGELQINLNNK